ncbi:ImmA/IrrE family metallo-endopeptidase [Amycolatopsis sp. NPDC089917]|uniref:ImmA/IrrE family metallo-endopeptidase n=1 Tax=Amycolatopsis sp. NPDC089917 TaxID=3155187 RepID=UPI0034315BDA
MNHERALTGTRLARSPRCPRVLPRSGGPRRRRLLLLHGERAVRFIDAGKTAERQRFDAARELGHLAMHQGPERVQSREAFGRKAFRRHTNDVVHTTRPTPTFSNSVSDDRERVVPRRPRSDRWTASHQPAGSRMTRPSELLAPVDRRGKACAEQRGYGSGSRSRLRDRQRGSGQDKLRLT